MKEAMLQVIELIQKVELFKGKQCGFAELFGAADEVKVPYFEIVSGRPSGEVYHRDVYVAFSEEDAEDCYSHIRDGYEDWQFESWLWGPHIHELTGNPAHTKVWNGFHEEPAPVWVKDLA